MQFYVDKSGNLAGGVPSVYDLKISGTFDYGTTHYEGVLVEGEVTNFGWSPHAYGYFDFTFDATGELLTTFYDDYNDRGGDYWLASQTNFSGDWEVSHSGTKTRHDTAPFVPEASTLMLFGSGLSGLLFFARRRRLMKFQGIRVPKRRGNPE